MTASLSSRNDEPNNLTEFLEALAAGGFTAEDAQDVIANPSLAAGMLALINVHRSHNLSWGVPFALMAGDKWRSLDGTDPGDIQFRASQEGVQVRLRCDCQVVGANLGPNPTHDAETCTNCWTTPREVLPSKQWRPIAHSVQIQVDDRPDPATGFYRVLVQRRINPVNPAQPESDWTGPWLLPRYSETQSYKDWKLENPNRAIPDWWVNVTDDVQISTHGVKHYWGIQVRRATRLKPEPEWTTPTFVGLPAKHEWIDLVPDGSIQVRFWVLPDPDKSYDRRVQVRMHAGRQVSLAAEPHWESISSELQSTGRGYIPAKRDEIVSRGKEVAVRGYRLRVLSTPGHHHQDPAGFSVQGPDFVQDVYVTDRWVLVAPDLRVEASFQSGSLSVEHGTYEPPAADIMWGVPQQREVPIGGWLQVADDVHIRRDEDCPHGFEVQRFRDDDWYSDGIFPFEVAHELTSNLRVTVCRSGSVSLQRRINPA